MNALLRHACPIMTWLIPVFTGTYLVIFAHLSLQGPIGSTETLNVDISLSVVSLCFCTWYVYGRLCTCTFGVTIHYLILEYVVVFLAVTI